MRKLRHREVTSKMLVSRGVSLPSQAARLQSWFLNRHAMLIFHCTMSSSCSKHFSDFPWLLGSRRNSLVGPTKLCVASTLQLPLPASFLVPVCHACPISLAPGGQAPSNHSTCCSLDLECPLIWFLPKPKFILHPILAQEILPRLGQISYYRFLQRF